MDSNTALLSGFKSKCWVSMEKSVRINEKGGIALTSKNANAFQIEYAVMVCIGGEDVDLAVISSSSAIIIHAKTNQLRCHVPRYF